MITYVKGKLVHATPSFAIIETGGVGYKAFIPVSAYPKLPNIGFETVLHTSLVIRENSQTLYGFVSNEERDCFEKLTAISGVGPKIALSLIGHMRPEQMLSAINCGDSEAISKVPGIGKKTAERLIIEMRGKTDTATRSLLSEFAIYSEHTIEEQILSDALNALIHLGYQQAAARSAVTKALKTLPENADLSTLITICLKHIS